MAMINMSRMIQVLERLPSILATVAGFDPQHCRKIKLIIITKLCNLFGKQFGNFL
jgi:hypothetical protein